MRAVKDYIGRSGVHYDAVGGCNIQGVAAEAAWKDFLKTDNLVSHYFYCLCLLSLIRSTGERNEEIQDQWMAFI